MTVSTPTANVPRAAAGATVSHRSRNIALAILAVIVLFAATYAFAWWQADRLTTQYLADADQTYASGDYLGALVGGQKFDLASNRYITTGGYLQVQHIWNNSYAWPRPAGLDHAQQRVDDIINHKLTVDQAQQFVQENTGKQNPYLGLIYLRLGELYQQQGDTKDARDVFQSVPQLFKDQPDLIKQAQTHLQQLPPG